MPRWNLTWLVVVPLTVAFAIALGYGVPPLRAKDKNADLLHLLVDVLAEVDQSYVRDLDDAGRRKFIEDMIHGGLERLDPHSAYFNAHEYRQFGRKSEGKYGGVGVNVVQDRVTGVMTVVSPMVGTPAYEAGVWAGDRVVAIDGKLLDAMPAEQAVELVQGDPGTIVTLTLARDGEPKPFDRRIVRDIVEIETVLGDRRDPENPKEWDYVIDPAYGIAHIRLSEFDKPTAPTLKRLLTHLDAAGVRGIALDLRGNPGGLLVSAVEAADLFLTSGTVVSTKSRRGGDRAYSAHDDALPFEKTNRPIAVLIDRGSASASEILAAALQDHGRAIVVGERSYGKGSVQEVFPLENQSVAVKLTTQSYRRPCGQNIHRFPDSKEADEWGVRPTAGYAVELSDEERRTWSAARKSRDAVRGKGREQSAGPPIVDKVLSRAVEYLRSELARHREP